MSILEWIGYITLALLAMVVAAGIGALPFWLPILWQRLGQKRRDKGKL